MGPVCGQAGKVCRGWPLLDRTVGCRTRAQQLNLGMTRLSWAAMMVLQSMQLPRAHLVAARKIYCLGDRVKSLNAFNRKPITDLAHRFQPNRNLCCYRDGLLDRSGIR